MTKTPTDWWVSHTHMYSREVGELRDLLERKNQIAEATIAKIKRCADEIERLREDKAELLEALRSIAYHRKGGLTNNKLAVQLERLAIDAIAKATGSE